MKGLLKETTHKMGKRDLFYLLSILLLSYLLFFFNLGSYSLKDLMRAGMRKFPGRWWRGGIIWSHISTMCATLRNPSLILGDRCILQTLWR
jgi:hypothetical protein